MDSRFESEVIKDFCDFHSIARGYKFFNKARKKTLDLYEVWWGYIHPLDPMLRKNKVKRMIGNIDEEWKVSR